MWELILIGVTGWSDHDTIFKDPNSKRNKLEAYASHFPTVEVDTSFYGIPSRQNTENWVKITTDSFQFIVKAYQGMTGHERGNIPYKDKVEMFTAFKDSIEPYGNKLAMVLFQFPPWFDCQKQNVDYLRWCKEQMGEIPCALEFRHQSWFKPAYKDKTIQFMREENWIHCICDEPQAGEGTIPIVLEPSNSDRVLVRFHGRNVHGWQMKNAPNWREVRYLYRYNEKELAEWAERLKKLDQECKTVYAVFNNNSGGDAADNAKQLIQMLNIEYKNLAPRQLELF